MNKKATLILIVDQLLATERSKFRRRSDAATPPLPNQFKVVNLWLFAQANEEVGIKHEAIPVAGSCYRMPVGRSRR